MNRTFGDYRAIVGFLLDQKKPLERAIEEAGVPLDFTDAIRAFYSEPIDIERPDLITGSGPSTFELCKSGAALDGPYFPALATYLANERRWSRSVIETIGATSSDLIGRLPNPNTNQTFACRGLVVGYVQSGKTANMAALIAKAADQGYKLIIVLAGLYKDLRSQTQRRLDQEVTGSSDNPADSPFVEHPPSAQKWSRLTHSGLNGDFEPGTHNDLHPATPKLAVLKKNVKVLERFVRWLERSAVPLDQLPALIIDDEADHGSINTNYGRVDEDGDEIDPSKTNGWIRTLLSLLPRNVYVGFTATPFANVLIDADVDADLYPRHFIASLPEPQGYLGARQLFGLGMAPSDLSPEANDGPALNVIRNIDGPALLQLNGLAADSDCPEILETALLSFLMSSGARLERGQTRSHFTMFIHPSFATAVQETFRAVVSREVEFLRVALRTPKKFPETERRARQLWTSDFGPSSRVEHSFEAVWRHARGLIEEIEIKLLNYGSQDVIDYATSPPRRYIVIGGNRLSRGLTLEGLSVSVFLRDTPYYDTLLQMGRWFGYRPNYEDLTRIYAEDRMVDQFADLARVELELRNDLRKYSQGPEQLSPGDIAPRIRAHPAMLVTARNKMGAGLTVSVALDGAPRETVTFPLESESAISRNIEVAQSFIKNLGSPAKSLTTDGMHIWQNVSASEVLKFVEAYQFSPASRVVTRQVLADYISELNRRGELRRWNVAIPRGNPKLNTFVWAPTVSSRKVQRKPVSQKSIGVLRSPPDIEAVRRETAQDGTDPDVGTLLIYAVDRVATAASGTGLMGNGKTDLVAPLFLFPRPRNFVPVPYVTQQGTT